MTTRKTSSSKSRTTSSKRSTGKKETISRGVSPKVKSSSPKSRTQTALKKNQRSLTTTGTQSKKKQSKTTTTAKAKAKTSTNSTKRTSTRSPQKQKDRGIKHTRSKNIELFPHNPFPWRLEPRTGKFNLSWFMCYDHAADQIERQQLQPRDYKLQCYISVPITDPLTGSIRVQRTVRGRY